MAVLASAEEHVDLASRTRLIFAGHPQLALAHQGVSPAELKLRALIVEAMVDFHETLSALYERNSVQDDVLKDLSADLANRESVARKTIARGLGITEAEVGLHDPDDFGALRDVFAINGG